MIEVTDSSFKTMVLDKSGKKAVIIEFWAPWCGACRVFTPVFKKVSSEYAKKAVFATVNVEENSVIPQMYGVMSIPNVKMFREGKVVAEFPGAIPEQDFRKWLEDNLK